MQPVGPGVVLPSSFGFANFRSFDEKGFCLRDLKKVNILIGKNNSGKSNTLRAIQLLSKLDGPRLNRKLLSPLTDRHRRAEKEPVILVGLPLGSLLKPKEEWHERKVSEFEKTTGPVVEVRWDPVGGQFLGAPALESLRPNELNFILEHFARRQAQRVLKPKEYVELLGPTLVTAAAQALNEPLRGMLSVPVFRQARDGSGGKPEDGVFSGLNIIDELRNMRTPLIGEDDKQDTFDKLQRFVRDLLGVPDLELEIPSQEQRLYVKMHGNRLHLESYGTGIHHLVLLCTALALHNGKVVTIEEPEVHLHPELQRKLLRFMVEQTDNTYFLTTHSNVFLDAMPDGSIHHVRYDGRASTVDPIKTTAASRDILTDMGYKASDLLQANAVVWVEGPSDRVYLNRWLGLLAPGLVEGIHYAVAFYGGKVLAHFSCTDDPVEDLVRVLCINRHAVVMIDRDGDGEDTTLNRTKSRVQQELPPTACWVTQGREVENYLPTDLVRRALVGRFPGVAAVQFGPNDNLNKVLTGLEGGPARYDKVAFARTFVAVMTADDLDVLDLRERVLGVAALIRRWNHADVPAPDPAAVPPGRG